MFTGACVALLDAVKSLEVETRLIASVSVGIVNGQPMLDLEYSEDSAADTDMNVVMTEQGQFIEVQGTAEAAPFSADELNEMLSLAKEGIKELIEIQRSVLTEQY